jgi:hypothetical protein
MSRPPARTRRSQVWPVFGKPRRSPAPPDQRDFPMARRGAQPLDLRVVRTSLAERWPRPSHIGGRHKGRMAHSPEGHTCALFRGRTTDRTRKVIAAGSPPGPRTTIRGPTARTTSRRARQEFRTHTRKGSAGRDGARLTSEHDLARCLAGRVQVGERRGPKLDRRVALPLWLGPSSNPADSSEKNTRDSASLLSPLTRLRLPTGATAKFDSPGKVRHGARQHEDGLQPPYNGRLQPHSSDRTLSPCVLVQN